MIKKTGIWALLFVFLYTLTSVSLANEDDRRHHRHDGHGSHGHQHGNDYQGQQRLLVKLFGWSQAYKPGSGEGIIEHVPDVDDDVVCQDVDMVDLQTNEVIATSTDCFSSIEPDSVTGGAGFTGTSYLNFPDGTIIAQGGFTAQPVIREATNIEGVSITSITGAAKEGNAIIGGTGKYEHVTGNVRVSGLINAEGYAFMPGDTMYFDCIFEIQLFD